jgi:hypothetical protein
MVPLSLIATERGLYWELSITGGSRAVINNNSYVPRTSRPGSPAPRRHGLPWHSTGTPPTQ